MFSVLILTRNEQQDLPGCLESLGFCDDIVVYDSFSTDNTCSIALSNGARFVQRPGQDPDVAFGGDEAFHRTWALREIVFQHPWLLVLDADERLSSACLNEISRLLSSSSIQSSTPTSVPPVAYRIRRRDFFQGRHLKHVQATPWYIRLFRPEFVHYERLVNPITVVNGPVGSLTHCIDHYPFSKGLSHWVDKHNAYSTLEALELANSPSLSPRRSNLIFSLITRDFHTRRASQKRLFYLLPARPLFRFFLLYFIKLGFLDGSPGFTYALLQAIYEYLIVLKQRELRRPHLPGPTPSLL